MQGLGDNIYIRSFVRELEDVYLETAWPELFSDLPIKLWAPTHTLRTQRKNFKRNTSKYQYSNIQGRRPISYGRAGPYEGLIQTFGFEPKVFDLPDSGPPIYNEPYALIRPVTERKEWLNISRNCLPEYISYATEFIKRRGIKTISVADLSPSEEWPIGELPNTDIKLHRGEATTPELMNLVQHCTLCVGPVGWLLPMGIAYKVPTWIVFGGQGEYNHPSKLTHSSMNLTKLGACAPEPMCNCRHNQHNCNKKIENYEHKFTEWFRKHVNLE